MYLEQMYAHNYIQWCKNEGHLLWVEVFWKNLYYQLYTQIAYVKNKAIECLNAVTYSLFYKDCMLKIKYRYISMSIKNMLQKMSMKRWSPV